MKVNIYNIEAGIYTFDKYTPSISERQIIFSPFYREVDIEEIVRKFPMLTISYQNKKQKRQNPNEPISMDDCNEDFLVKIFETCLEKHDRHYDHIIFTNKDREATEPFTFAIKLTILTNIDDTEIFNNISTLDIEKETKTVSYPTIAIEDFIKRLTIAVAPSANWNEFQETMKEIALYLKERDRKRGRFPNKNTFSSESSYNYTPSIPPILQPDGFYHCPTSTPPAVFYNNPTDPTSPSGCF